MIVEPVDVDATEILVGLNWTAGVHVKLPELFARVPTDSHKNSESDTDDGTTVVHPIGIPADGLGVAGCVAAVS